MDENRVRQIVSQLVSNSIKFTPDNGSVEVEARVISKGRGLGLNWQVHPDLTYCLGSDDMLMISVSDTGNGVDKDIHSQLFEPFGLDDVS